jgi:hypothetical protein
MLAYIPCAIGNKLEYLQNTSMKRKVYITESSTNVCNPVLRNQKAQQLHVSRGAGQ